MSTVWLGSRVLGSAVLSLGRFATGLGAGAGIVAMLTTAFSLEALSP